VRAGRRRESAQGGLAPILWTPDAPFDYGGGVSERIRRMYRIFAWLLRPARAFFLPLRSAEDARLVVRTAAVGLLAYAVVRLIQERSDYSCLGFALLSVVWGWTESRAIAAILLAILASLLLMPVFDRSGMLSAPTETMAILAVLTGIVIRGSVAALKLRGRCGRTAVGASRRRLKSIVARVTFGVWLMVTAAYVYRSVQGRYEPAFIGLSGVKWYDWAPRGFVQEYRWNHRLIRWYSIYFELDNVYWHPRGKIGDIRDDLPVNEVPRDQIWKVYTAWEKERLPNKTGEIE